MKNAFQKLKDKVGFTLAETLLAVLIMLLVSGIVAAGIPAAKNAYERVVLASNADLLLSTTISYLRSELSAVGELHISKAEGAESSAKETVITYFNKTSNTMSKIYLGDSTKHLENGDSTIKYQRYSSTNWIPSRADDSVDLISPEASAADLYVTYQYVDYSEQHVLTFHNLQVKRRAGAILASRDTFSIWVLEY